MPDPVTPSDLLGQNAWLVDEMFDAYRADPSSVSPSWQEFFADYAPTTLGHATAGGNGGPAVAPTVEAVGKRLRILTFAGGQVNNLLARYLELHMGSRVASNNYWLMVDLEASRLAEILVCIGGPDDLAAATVEVPRGRLSKFQELLPPQLEREFLLERLYDIPATLEVVERLKEARWQL